MGLQLEKRLAMELGPSMYRTDEYRARRPVLNFAHIQLGRIVIPDFSGGVPRELKRQPYF